MKAIIVCVDFSDLLAVTLPRNRKHFNDVMVVTTLNGGLKEGGDPAVFDVAKANGAKVFQTNLFTDKGAAFNKWAALEAGWDAFGREGWLCHLDVDVIWPEGVEVQEFLTGPHPVIGFHRNKETTYVVQGQLFSPLRRMLNDVTRGIPPESDWDMLPIHPNRNEHAGYTQIFHVSDPVLGSPPWHETDYIHAGAADSWFQQKWAPQNKVRPPWQVLHLGRAGTNWYGRVTPHLDGTKVEGAEEREKQVMDMWAQRRAREAAVRAGQLPREQLFDAEKIRQDR